MHIACSIQSLNAVGDKCRHSLWQAADYLLKRKRHCMFTVHFVESFLVSIGEDIGDVPQAECGRKGNQPTCKPKVHRCSPMARTIYKQGDRGTHLGQGMQRSPWAQPGEVEQESIQAGAVAD